MARLTGVALFLLQALDWHFQSTSSGQSSFKTRHRRQTPPTRPNNPPPNDIYHSMKPGNGQYFTQSASPEENVFIQYRTAKSSIHYGPDSHLTPRFSPLPKQEPDGAQRIGTMTPPWRFVTPQSHVCQAQTPMLVSCHWIPSNVYSHNNDVWWLLDTLAVLHN